MVRISIRKVNELIVKYKINTSVVSRDTLIYGIQVELEHGRKFGANTNIINDDIELAFRIVLAHLQEASNYYEYLKKMETKLDKYWSTRKKKSIFI
jgi:hypothetical protein